MSYDTMRRKDIPSIYARSAYISHIHKWPQGGLSVKPIQGRHIVNNSGKVIYATGTDGVMYAVPPLSDQSREILLRQLYYMLGGELQARNPGDAKNRRLFLDPIPDAKHISRCGRDFFYDVSRWYIGDDNDVPMFTQRLHPYTLEDEKYLEFEKYIPTMTNEYIQKANDIDTYCPITSSLRRNEPCVYIVNFMFEENLKYHVDDIQFAPKVFNHVYRENQAPELFRRNFDVFSPDGAAGSAEEVISSRHPCMLYHQVSLKLLERAHQGHYLPEHGLTISTQTDMINKAIGFALPESDVYMARSGLRIVIPQRPAGVSVMYCRIGKHISRINCVDNPDTTGRQAIAYCYDATGDEVIAGSCPVDELLSKGMSLSTPDGVSWHIPFFATKNAAIEYYDPEDKAVFDRQRETIATMDKKLKLLEAEVEKEKERKRKGAIAWVVGLMTHTKTVAVITGIIITVITTIIGLLTRSGEAA